MTGTTIISKLKEVLICLRAKRVTFRYPLAPMPAPRGFRGRPTIDGTKCIGCGACAAVCPPRLIDIYEKKHSRVVELNYSRCTYCARCQQVCPVDAMTCTEDFETATDDRGNYTVSVELDTVSCKQCGVSFNTQRMQRKLIDEFSPPWMEVKKEIPEWLELCQECRSQNMAVSMRRNIKNG